MHWRRKWQPTPAFLPGESHGQRRLVGYSPWGCKESDRTERLHFTSLHFTRPLSFRAPPTSLPSFTCGPETGEHPSMHSAPYPPSSGALASGTLNLHWQRRRHSCSHSGKAALRTLSPCSTGAVDSSTGIPLQIKAYGLVTCAESGPGSCHLDNTSQCR